MTNYFTRGWTIIIIINWCHKILLISLFPNISLIDILLPIKFHLSSLKRCQKRAFTSSRRSQHNKNVFLLQFHFINLCKHPSGSFIHALNCLSRLELNSSIFNRLGQFLHLLMKHWILGRINLRFILKLDLFDLVIGTYYLVWVRFHISFLFSYLSYFSYLVFVSRYLLI